jgi:hypothetical protein
VLQTLGTSGALVRVSKTMAEPERKDESAGDANKRKQATKRAADLALEKRRAADEAVKETTTAAEDARGGAQKLSRDKAADPAARAEALAHAEALKQQLALDTDAAKAAADQATEAELRAGEAAAYADAELLGADSALLFTRDSFAVDLVYAAYPTIAFAGHDDAALVFRLEQRFLLRVHTSTSCVRLRSPALFSAGT